MKSLLQSVSRYETDGEDIITSITRHSLEKYLLNISRAKLLTSEYK